MSETLTPNPPFRLSAWSFLLFMVLAGMAGTWTFWKAGSSMLENMEGPVDILAGKTAKRVEKLFDDASPLHDPALHLWSAINYSVFHTGADKVVIGRDNWLFTDEEFQWPEGGEQESSNKLNIIPHIRDALAAKGVSLIIVLLPNKSRLYPEFVRVAPPGVWGGHYDTALGRLHKSGVHVIDGLAVMKNLKISGTQAFMRTDTHWTPQAAQSVADHVAKALPTAFPDLTLMQASVISTMQERDDFLGDLGARFVATGPFQPYVGPAQERLRQGKTSVVSADAGLFGNAPVDVALVGTSYSYLEEWNFVGALKNALQADVVNLADPGKGPMQPMFDFVKNTDFSASPYKLVVWEIPERFLPVHYDIDWVSVLAMQQPLELGRVQGIPIVTARKALKHIL